MKEELEAAVHAGKELLNSEPPDQAHCPLRASSPGLRERSYRWASRRFQGMEREGAEHPTLLPALGRRGREGTQGATATDRGTPGV